MKTIFLTTLLASSFLSADTILTGDTRGETNSIIDQTYGDRVTENGVGARVTESGTAGLELTWLSGRWENHSWDGVIGVEGSVMQLESSDVEAKHSIRFSPKSSEVGLV